VWGLAFGARVSNLKVGKSGGSVSLSKSNVWITLAPYFFPFWTIIVVVAALVTRCFVSPLPWPCAWLFAIAFTWCFHVCFTIRSLMQPQPDVQEYGRLFSYVLIWTFNVAGVIAWIACTTEVTWRAVGECLWGRISGAYLAIGLRLFETVSKDNVASYKSALSASNVKVLKELPHNELYLEILPK
jgi:hypothetical protein